ncbi:hypothetical protein GGI03_005688, partial [Coemansia sp. RSA 2337]
AKIATSEGAVKKREDDVKKDEATIEVRNAALEEREATLETREDDIEERESKVKEHEATFEEREAALEACKIAIEEQATALEQCEDTAAEYDEPDTDVAMVEGIDHAIDHEELQQESLNMGIALAEARHKASLLVVARAELCDESAIAAPRGYHHDSRLCAGYLDSAIVLVDTNFGSVATLEVATTHAKCHMDIVTALNRTANIINLLQACKELDPDCRFAKIVDSLDCTTNLGGEYLVAVAAGDDIADGAEILEALENAIAGAERHL